MAWKKKIFIVRSIKLRNWCHLEKTEMSQFHSIKSCYATQTSLTSRTCPWERWWRTSPRPPPPPTRWNRSGRSGPRASGRGISGRKRADTKVDQNKNDDVDMTSTRYQVPVLRYKRKREGDWGRDHQNGVKHCQHNQKLTKRGCQLHFPASFLTERVGWDNSPGSEHRHTGNVAHQPQRAHRGKEDPLQDEG